MKRYLAAAAALAIGGCTLSAGQQQAITAATGAVAAVTGTLDPAVAADGTLFCEVAGGAGPLFASPAAVNVIGKSAPYVAAACAAWRPGAVPVPPPAVPSVPVVATGG